MDYKKDYLDIVKERLKESRYIHTLGVVDEALILSEIYGENKDKARIAASLHDIAKYIDIDIQKEMIRKNFGEEILNDLVEGVYHSYTGYLIARDELEIDDIDILNAILYHTIGRPNMSTLEKIVFVSDFAEANRNFKESRICHELALKSLDEAVYYEMDEQIKFNEKKNNRIPKMAIEARNYYRRLLNIE